MPETNNKPARILHELLNVAEDMIASGAEVKRVEDTLIRMGRAYGAAKMNVFVITSSVVVTMIMPDGSSFTQTRRILSPGDTDFSKLEAVNALSRECCATGMPVEILSEKLKEIEKTRVKKSTYYLGSVLAAGGFAVFFGGGIWDGVAAAVFALLICVLQDRVARFCPNRVVFNLICAFLTGVGICLAARIMPGLRVDKIMIGDIMLLIPGIAMTNAVKDVLVGETISGIMRLIETLLWSGGLACGFMMAIWLIGG